MWKTEQLNHRCKKNVPETKIKNVKNVKNVTKIKTFVNVE